MTASSSHPFSALSPERVLDAVESFGFRCDGRLLELNSYENRVYQAGIEEGPGDAQDNGIPISQWVVAKFYRPDRWSDQTIAEEHEFALALAAEDIPVIPPLQVAGKSLLHEQGFAVALYRRVSGRPPEFESSDHLQWLGRLLARIHAIGATQAFVHRGELNAQSFGFDALESLQGSGQVPQDLAGNYFIAAQAAVERADQVMADFTDYRRIRLHGDFHPGNILWGSDGPLIVDLDDARMGPAIQDLWMLLSGNRDECSAQLAAVIEGYEQFRVFDRSELVLIEPLRTLRLVHYAGWLAQRWDDPAFPAAFPWFASPRWWEDQITTLHEQLERMAERPLNPDRILSEQT